MYQRNCIKKWNQMLQGHLKCWLWYLSSLLRAEHKFTCGIIDLRKADHVKNRWKHGCSQEMILNNRRMTIRDIADNVCILLGSCQAIFTDVLGMKRFKIVKFWAKTTSQGHQEIYP